MGLFHEIADGFIGVEDIEDARKVTDKMLDLARQPYLFPAAQLAAAAAAFNDIGDHGRVIQILREATDKLPDSKKVLAIGMTTGPVTGATLNVGDSIRSSIAIEFYRAGERDEFAKQLLALSPEYVTSTWMDLYAAAHRRGESSPSPSEVLKALPPDARVTFENEEAVDAIISSDFERAKELLQNVLDDFAKSQASASTRQLLVTAKIAFAGGFADITANALHEAATAGRKLEDRGKRASELASVAVLSHELLSR
jgi:hypothetical protein